MSFNDYWKKKSARRRKSWATRNKRYVERHNQLEVIRQEMFQPMDERKLVTYLKPHYTEKNPIVCWQNGIFSFSETGLREAMKQEKADMTCFKLEMRRKPIHGTDDFEHEKKRRESTAYFSNVWNYSLYLWLEEVYKVSSEVETVLLKYKDISMIINRYSKDNIPFGYYEVLPCEQLSSSALQLQETNFYTLNIATLLMEMAAEWELRHEEYNYHAKKLKLQSLEAIVCDSINFELWDEKKIQKKVEEYFKKGYTQMEMYEHILRPWVKGVKRFMELVTTRDMMDKSLEFKYYYKEVNHFTSQILCPYLERQGLHDFRLFVPAFDDYQIIIDYQGYRVSMHCNIYQEVDAFYPYAFCDKFIEQQYRHYDKLHISFNMLTISAVAEYLKRMPVINEKIDKVIEIIDMKYSEQKNKTEE